MPASAPSPPLAEASERPQAAALPGAQEQAELSTTPDFVAPLISRVFDAFDDEDH